MPETIIRAEFASPHPATVCLAQGDLGTCASQCVLWAAKVLEGTHPQDAKPTRMEAQHMRARGLVLATMLHVENFEWELIYNAGLDASVWKTNSYAAACLRLLKKPAMSNVFLLKLTKGRKTHMMAFANLECGQFFFDPIAGLYQFGDVEVTEAVFAEASRAVKMYPASQITIYRLRAQQPEVLACDGWANPKSMFEQKEW